MVPVTMYCMHMTAASMQVNIVVLQVGNLQPLFKEEYPKCWGTHEECSARLLSSVHYTQVQALTLHRQI